MQRALRRCQLRACLDSCKPRSAPRQRVEMEDIPNKPHQRHHLRGSAGSAIGARFIPGGRKKKSNFCKEKRDDKVTSLTRNCSLPMWPFGSSKRTNLVCQGVALRKPRLLSVTHNWTRWSGETAIRIHEEFTPFAHEQKGIPPPPPAATFKLPAC